MSNKPSKELISQLLPNTFPFPNVIMDEQEKLAGNNIWSLLEPYEQVLLPIVYRKTFGWWKKSDRISISQLAGLSGLAEATIRKHMKNLVEIGLITRAENDSLTFKEGVEWSPEIDDHYINFAYLLDRKQKQGEKNLHRTKKATIQSLKVRRQKPPLTSHVRGNVARNSTPNVGRNSTPNVARKGQKPEETKENQLRVQPLTEKEIADANAFTDAIIAQAKRAEQADKYPLRTSFPSAFLPYADLYVELTGQKPKKKNAMDWLKTFQEWLEDSITEEMIRDAYRQSRVQNFSVTRPGSLDKTLDWIQGLYAKGERPVFGEQDENPYAGQQFKFT